MKKYRFKRHPDTYSICIERCDVLNDGTRIGSTACQLCEFCVGHDKPKTQMGSCKWIKCSRLKEAIGDGY